MKKIIFVLAAVITSSQLWAQDSLPVARVVETAVPYHTPKDIEKTLDPVVLSSTKYPTKTSLTGKVISVITKEQLERSGGKDLSQLLTEQAGIFIAGANSSSGKDKSVYLRGAKPEYMLILVDGIPVYDQSGIASNFDIRNLSIQNIERIEILRGSQSTLYGSDAIAGVINIFTRKGSFKPVAGNAMISYGSNETFKATAGINGQKDNIDYRVSYSFHDTKGINEAINKTNAPVTDRDGFTQHNVILDMGIRATKKIYIQPFFRYGSIKGDIDQGAFTDELDYTFTQKSWQAGLRNNFIFGKTNLTLLYNYNSIDRSYTDDSTKSRNGFDTWVHSTYKGHEHFIDAYITTPLTKELKLTGGVDFRSGESDQHYSSIGFFGPYNTTYASDSLHQQQVAVYAALVYNATSGLNIEAGGRVNFHNEYGSHAVFNFNPSFLIHERFKVFANFSSGYRTPSLYQLYSEYGNKKLKPESAISIEGGLQYYSGDNKFNGRATVFSRNIKDVIFFFYNSSTFVSQYINQDKQKDHGFELEATYTITKDINLKAFYAFVTGEITTKNAGKDTTYNNLLRRPKSSAGIHLGVKFCKSFYASTSLSIVGERKDAYFDNSTFSTVYETLDSYLLWNVYAEYGFLKNRLKLFADLRNISNSKYVETSGYNTLGSNGYGGIRFTF